MRQVKQPTVTMKLIVGGKTYRAFTDNMMRLHVRQQIHHAGVYYVFFHCVPFFHHVNCVFQMQRKHAEMQKEQLMVPQSITCLIRTSATSTSGAMHPETKA